jgi:hypothetical protein
MSDRVILLGHVIVALISPFRPAAISGVKESYVLNWRQYGKR